MPSFSLALSILPAPLTKAVVFVTFAALILDGRELPIAPVLVETALEEDLVAGKILVEIPPEDLAEKLVEGEEDTFGVVVNGI